MEILGNVIPIGLIVLIIAIPILAVLKSYGFLRVNIVSIPLIWLLVTAVAYWPHFYADIRLELMGFDFKGAYSAERLRNIPVELHKEALRLYRSDIGIGWSAQAIIGCVLLAPYPTIVWGAGALVKYIKGRRNNEVS